MDTSLEDKFKSVPSLRDALRNAPTGFYVFPVPDEHTNWRDEQYAWKNSAILFDQSYHMLDVYVSGPEKVKFLSDISINNLSKFEKMKAVQLVCCAKNGYIIGDAVAFHLQDGTINIVGKPACGNWITYCAERGDYDVEIKRDARTLESDQQRLTYRFQIQGPNAYKILEQLTGEQLPELKFFGMCELSLKGHKVTALRHGMADAPGMEFWGPYEEKEAIRKILIEAGRDYNLKLGGGKTYSTAGPQSGWVGSVMPAIYNGEHMKEYREWLPANGFEGMLSIGGSFMPENIEDYYMDPWDLGYHRLIYWDHDFIGREALLKKRDNPHRKKIWLKWKEEDVLKIVGSMFNEDERYKYLETPAAHYATIPYDKVQFDDKEIGVSVYAAYTVSAKGWFSIGIINEDEVEYGKEIVITWGEPEGVTGKLTVEPHKQTTIRAIISKTALG